MKYYNKLIFELSREGRSGYVLPSNPYVFTTGEIGQSLKRGIAPKLPQVSEPDVVRHYTNLSQMNFGVDTGFYPLGSCTMKYNPKINEETWNNYGFQSLHPLQADATAQGALEVYYELDKALSAITGMSKFTFAPCAGAHGELTGLMIMKQYHLLRGDKARTKVIVPDSAHGTNPASAAVCGLDVVEVKSNAEGLVDVEDLKPLLGDDIAGIMMTNPNTLGLFETEIEEIAALIHGCGGLLYYDGANMNPLLGKVRPGDMGFDIMHLNLHKTFSTPHGGGGPGAGPVGVCEKLVELLPAPFVIKKEDGSFKVKGRSGMPLCPTCGKPKTWKGLDSSIGVVSGFMGNFGILVRALTYILTLGRENVLRAGEMCVLPANYIKESLKDLYKLPIEKVCKHEFVFDGLVDDGSRKDAEGNVTRQGATTLDVAKRLLDYGFHAPTIYFPLLFHQAMMIEPTETESKETIDAFIEVMRKIAAEAAEDPQLLKNAPSVTPIRRPDETTAAREPVLRYNFE